MMQEAQSQRVLLGIGAGEARAAQHDIGAVLADIGPKALPQQLDRAAVAVGLQHAGAAQLHEAMGIALAGDQRGDVVFALGVEAFVLLGDVLREDAVGTNHLGAFEPWVPSRPLHGFVDNQEMVANGVVFILVALLI